MRNGSRSGLSVVPRIRDALPPEAAALAALQRRSSDVWEEYRAALAANPDAIEPPSQAIAEGRVRVAVDASQRRLGFSVVLRVEHGRCVHDAVASLPGVEQVEVELTFDPPWTPDRMSDDAKFILGFG